VSRVMDYETADHFYAWLDRYVAPERQSDAENVIHKLLADHPDLVLTHSWPDMLALAERNYQP
jgi:hypothetical protein